MARSSDTLDPLEPELLDAETWDLPRRMTRREGALSAGPDWVWTQPHFEEADADD